MLIIATIFGGKIVGEVAYRKSKCPFLDTYIILSSTVS